MKRCSEVLGEKRFRLAGTLLPEEGKEIRRFTVANRRRERYPATNGSAGGKLPVEVANQLPPINWFSARGFINSGVEGQVRVETRDETSAKNLQDVVRGFMALGRLQSGKHPEFGEFLNSVQLSGEGKTVSLSFSLPPEMIDALGALRAQRQRQRTTPAPAPRPDGPPAL